MILHYEIQIKRKDVFELILACTLDYQPDSALQWGIMMVKDYRVVNSDLLPVSIMESNLLIELYETFTLEIDKWGIETNLRKYIRDNYWESGINEKIIAKNLESKSLAALKDFSFETISEKNKISEIEHFEAAPELKYVTYDVLFGTNRNKKGSAGNSTFGKDRDTKLHTGKCVVSIPLNHETASLERPGWFRELIFGESPEKDFTILSTEEMNLDAFGSELQKKLAHSDEEDVLLFIHGYNSTCKDAVMRAAQLGYDLNFKGAVTAFTWPSLGTVGGYLADMDSARLSSGYLLEFLREILKASTKKLYIIAHSMGNVVLTEALVKMKEANEFPSKIIHEIVLAAPDIDKDIFVTEIMPKICGATRLTLYASENDKALLASEQFRYGYDRIGQGGAKLTIFNGVESIDATTVDTDLLGHGYYAETKALINDIHQVLLGVVPDRRVLDPVIVTVNDVTKKYWRFRNPLLRA